MTAVSVKSVCGVTQKQKSSQSHFEKSDIDLFHLERKQNTINVKHTQP